MIRSEFLKNGTIYQQVNVLAAFGTMSGWRWRQWRGILLALKCDSQRFIDNKN